MSISQRPLDTNDSIDATLQFNTRRLKIARTVFVFIFLLSLGFMIAAIPLRIQKLSEICEPSDCIELQVTPEGEAALTEIGVSLPTYIWLLMILEGVSIIVFSVSAIFIMVLRGNNWVALLVALLLVTYPMGLGLVDALTATYPILTLPVNVLRGLGNGLVVLLFLLFPHGHFIPSRSRWLGYFSVIFFVTLGAFGLLGRDIDAIATLILYICGLLAQLYRYKTFSRPIEKQQTKWVVIGIVIWFISALFFYLPPLLFPDTLRRPEDVPLMTVMDFFFWIPYIYIFVLPGFLALPMTITISILRFRLWDVDPLLNRGLVYGIVTLLSLTILSIIILIVQVILSGQLLFITILLASVVAGLSFYWLRYRVQHFVDRYIYGFAFDLYELRKRQSAPTITNHGFLSGQVLNGYEVGSLIGRGGMGEVYEGFGSGQQVAIKTLLPSMASDPSVRSRFEREIKVGKQLRHPNIATLYDSGEYQGMPYLIMEYINGQTIRDLINHDGRIDIEVVLRIMNNIRMALQLVHETGFIHRDLKPSNVMLRPDGQAVLLDFGITKMIGASEQLTGTSAVGTIAYMAPEQIMASQDVDVYADIYALGVMVYEMLTGELPFKGNVTQMLFAHIYTPPPNPSEDTMPRYISKSILKALSKKPDDRFSSVDAFVLALASPLITT